MQKKKTFGQKKKKLWEALENKKKVFKKTKWVKIVFFHGIKLMKKLINNFSLRFFFFF